MRYLLIVFLNLLLTLNTSANAATNSDIGPNWLLETAVESFNDSTQPDVQPELILAEESQD